jgi:probable addiction module antidote protein
MIKNDFSNVRDIFEQYADKIKGNIRELRKFEKAVNEAYNATGDIDVILTALRIIATVKGNVSTLARKSNIDRKSLYNMFKANSNPTLNSFSAVLRNLDVKMNLSFNQPSV